MAHSFFRFMGATGLACALAGCVSGPVYITKVEGAEPADAAQKPANFVTRNTAAGSSAQETLTNAEVRTHLPGRWKTVARDRALFPTVYGCDGNALVMRDIGNGRFEASEEATQRKFVIAPTNVSGPSGQRLRADLKPLFAKPGNYLMTMNAVNNYLVIAVPGERRLRAMARCET